MKTLSLRSAAVLFSVLASFLFSATAGAQGISKSDTVTMNTPRDSMHFFLRDFGPLSLKDTECHTIYLRNTLSEAIIVNSAYAYAQGNNGGFFAKTIPTLPTVMLPNEIVSIANVC